MSDGGTVSPMMRLSDGKQQDDKKGQAEETARRGQGQGVEGKPRPQQGGRVSLKSFLPGVLG